MTYRLRRPELNLRDHGSRVLRTLEDNPKGDPLGFEE